MTNDVLYVSKSDSYVHGHMIKRGEIVNVQSIMHNFHKTSFVSFITRLGQYITMDMNSFDSKFKLDVDENDEFIRKGNVND